MVKSRRVKIDYRKLGRERAFGFTDGIDLAVDSRLKGKKKLEIINHELLHYLFPSLEEDEIIEKSIILTNTLWDQGYRQTDNDNSVPMQDGKK